MKKVHAAYLLGSTALLLVGCGDSNPSSQTTSANATAAASGTATAEDADKFVAGLNDDIRKMQPYQSAAAWLAATYITDAQVKTVNALPGVDRQIISTDIGKLNLAVGIVHRGPTTAPGS